MSCFDDVPIRDVLKKALLLDQQNVCELLMVHHAEPSEMHFGYDDELFCDSPLSNEGLSQAFLVSKRLEDFELSAVYSCPCSSCLQTAETIAVPHELVVTTMMDISGVRLFVNSPPDAFVPALREAMVRYQDEIERVFAASGRWTAFPFCEMSTEFRHRIRQAIDELLDHHIGETVVLVADSTVINGYIAGILDIPRDMWFNPEPGSVNIVRASEGKRVLYCVNVTAHLRMQK